MKKSEIGSTIVGVMLLALAAFFTISLLLVFGSAIGLKPSHASMLYKTGRMLTVVYGFSSVLIPLFFVVATIQCFSRSWTIKRGVLLLGSIIPFFTLDAVEHVCRLILAVNSGSVLGIKMTTALLIGLVIVAIEYALLGMLGDVLCNKFSPSYADYSYNDEDADSDEDSVEQFEEEDEAAAEEVLTESEEPEEGVAEETVIEESDETEPGEEPEVEEQEEITTPETLDNGEDNPFAHLFKSEETEKVEEEPEENEGY